VEERGGEAEMGRGGDEERRRWGEAEMGRKARIPRVINF
jgi:hypothetical protein